MGLRALFYMRLLMHAVDVSDVHTDLEVGRRAQRLQLSVLTFQLPALQERRAPRLPSHPLQLCWFCVNDDPISNVSPLHRSTAHSSRSGTGSSARTSCTTTGRPSRLQPRPSKPHHRFGTFILAPHNFQEQFGCCLRLVLCRNTSQTP